MQDYARAPALADEVPPNEVAPVVRPADGLLDVGEDVVEDLHVVAGGRAGV